MNQPSHPMEQYHELIRDIEKTGVNGENRTGENATFRVGKMLQFDMADGFPALTTRYYAFKSAKGEFIGFLRAFQSAAQFEAIGCPVWTANANKTPSWLNNPNRRGDNDLGRVYGAQWMEWRDWREVKTREEAYELVKQGYEIRAFDPARSNYVLRRNINQMENALRLIMTDPTSRKILVTGWNPAELDQMALEPCHVDYHFTVDVANKKLHLCFFQRSFDVALGFNIVLGALMLHIMAKMSGYTPGTLTQFISNAHVYDSHWTGLEKMLSREHFPQATLVLGDSIPVLSDPSEIPGVFSRIQPEDISLENYQSHDRIKFNMAF